MNTAAVTTTSPVPYTDRRRYLWLSQPFLPLLPTVSCALAVQSDAAILYWLTAFFWFVLVAFVDEVLPKDGNNPPETALDDVEVDQYYERILYASMPGYLINFAYVCWFVSAHEIAVLSYIGIAVSMGIVSGLALAVGHEFGHKTSRWHRRAGKFFLSIAGEGQFLIAHTKRHHVDVATPKDLASSQMGESLYHFGFWRQQPGFFRESWALERERLARLGKTAWSLEKETLQQYLITIGVYGGLTAIFGLIVLPLLLLQMYVCWWYLSLIEYCQHYGLKRELKADGTYRLATPQHSWNTNMLTSNNLLLNFVRHSPHHARSTRWYQALRDLEETPTLPYCYSLMFLAAMVPPVFYRLMDQRVVDWADGDLDRINMHAPAKERLRETYQESTK